MKIIEYIEQLNLYDKNELERAKLLCFFHYKETNNISFSMTLISVLMENSGFNKPNPTRLKNKLIKGNDKVMLTSKSNKGTFEFIPVVLQKLDKELGRLWNDTEKIISTSELIEEVKFCGKRNYLDRLIKQINHCYSNNCFDACAVLMRRLFEILIISSFQHLNIEHEIKDSNGNYVELKSLVKKMQNNTTLKLGRIKKDFDTIREVGNYSAHGFTYTAGKKDIDDIKRTYRVMLEELYNKSGLI